MANYLDRWPFFIARQSQGSCKIIAVKPLKHKRAAKWAQNEKGRRPEIECEDDTLPTPPGETALNVRAAAARG